VRAALSEDEVTKDLRGIPERMSAESRTASSHCGMTQVSRFTNERVVARLVPVRGEADDSNADTNYWTEWDALAAEIGQAAPAVVSAVDAVGEQRREFQ